MSKSADKPRSIRFPQDLWDAIDKDAKANKRSAVRQMETILSLYYGIQDTSVDLGKLEAVREIGSRQTNFEDDSRLLKNANIEIPEDLKKKIS